MIILQTVEPVNRTYSETMNEVATVDVVLHLAKVLHSDPQDPTENQVLCLRSPLFSTSTPFLYVCLFWYIINLHQDNVQNSQEQKERRIATLA